jgi:hypothetical protein
MVEKLVTKVVNSGSVQDESLFFFMKMGWDSSIHGAHLNFGGLKITRLRSLQRDDPPGKDQISTEVKNPYCNWTNWIKINWCVY